MLLYKKLCLVVHRALTLEKIWLSPQHLPPWVFLLLQFILGAPHLWTGLVPSMALTK